MGKEKAFQNMPPSHEAPGPVDSATREVQIGPSFGGVRRRGRPYRLPSDPSPHDAPLVSANHRIAWLLGVSRIHADDPDLAMRARFMLALQETGAVVDATRMSRWESGKVRVSPEVISAYEKVLGRPAGELGLVATTLSHTAMIPLPNERTAQDPLAIHQQLDAHFSLVFGTGSQGARSSDQVDGTTWMRLATLLTRQPHIYLLPETWTSVTETLTSDLARSGGSAYRQRLEALRVLVGHPVSQDHAVRAIGSIVTGPAAEFVVHPLALLAEIDGPKVTSLLLKTYNRSPGRLRAGAAWAIAGRVTKGHFRPEEVDVLAASVVELLRRSGSPIERLDALTVYAALPESAQTAVAHALRRDPEIRASLHLARTESSLYPLIVTLNTTATIADIAQEATPVTYVVERDQMLHRLVHEMLFHVRHDRRQEAAILLGASPYRAALVEPLLALASGTDEITSTTAIIGLHHLADPAHRDHLFEVALQDPRPVVRIVALTTAAEVIGTLTSADSARLLARPDRGAAEIAAVRHLLGRGRSPELSVIAAGDGPGASNAQWWLDNPPILEGLRS